MNKDKTANEQQSLILVGSGGERERESRERERRERERERERENMIGILVVTHDLVLVSPYYRLREP